MVLFSVSRRSFKKKKKEIALEPRMQMSWPSLPRAQAQLCTARLLRANNEVPQTHKPGTRV